MSEAATGTGVGEVEVDKASKEFRSTLDALVSFVGELACQSEEALVARLKGHSGASVDPQSAAEEDAYSRMHVGVLLPLTCLIEAVHRAMSHVEDLARTQQELAPNKHKLQIRKSKPAPPPTIMSITHLRALYTAIELLWCWGVESVLAARKLVTPASFASSQASYPKSLLVSSPLMQSVFNTLRTTLQQKDLIEAHTSTLWDIVLIINQSVRHMSLRGMMLQRNLQRLVLAAIALQPYVSPPTSPSSVPPPSPTGLLDSIEQSDDVVLYIQALQHVSRVGCRVAQHTAAGLLTTMLLRTDLQIGDSTDPVDCLGLAVLLRMHLHKGVADSANPTDLLVRIAKLMTSVPAAYARSTGKSSSMITPATIAQVVGGEAAKHVQQKTSLLRVPVAATTHVIQHSPNASNLPPSPAPSNDKDDESHCQSKSVFFDNISSQTFLLMTDTVQKSKSVELTEGSSYILRVCVLMTARIAHMAPNSAHTFIFQPLSEMLKPAGAAKETDDSSEGKVRRKEGGVAGELAETSAEEEGERVSTCVRVLHWVITCFPLSSPILLALKRTDIVASLFSLQMHLIASTLVIASDIKGQVADISIKILQNSSDPSFIVYIFEDLIVHGLKFGYKQGGDGRIVVVKKTSSVMDAEGGGMERGLEMDFLSSLLREAEASFGSDTSREGGNEGSNLLSLAGQMNGLVQRAQTVCHLLSSTFTLTSSSDGNGVEGSKRGTTQKKSKTGGSYRVSTKQKPKNGLIGDRDEDNCEESNPSKKAAARVTSLLFLRALSGYLSLSVPAEEPDLPAPTHVPAFPPPHICGATLLVLKNNISLDVLLHDSTQIIQLLGFFLENRANEIARTAILGNKHPQPLFAGEVSNTQQVGEDSYVHNLLSSRDNSGDKRPLIEEIFDNNDDQGKRNTAVKKNTSTHDIGNPFRSLNSLPLYGPNSDEDDECGEREEEEDIVTTVLALLVSMLEMGAQFRSDAEETLLREALLPHLVTIAGQDRNVAVAQTASDLCLIIMTRNTTTPKETALSGCVVDDGDVSMLNEDQDQETGGMSAFQKVCHVARRDYIFDESPAMRGLGVRTLIVALREPPEPLSAHDLQEASSLLLHLMQDQESFVYLNAVHAIGRLIDHHREELFKTFLSYYSLGLVPQAPLLAPTAVSSSGVGDTYQLSLRHRAVLSEAICCALRRADQMAHRLVPSVVAACLSICRRRTALQATLDNLNRDESSGDRLIDVDLTAMRVSIVTVKEEGEEGRVEGNVATAQREAAVSDVCVSADEVLFRQSAYSLLAEAIGLAGLTARHHFPDVVDVAVGTLRHETTTVNNNYQNVRDVIPVRRSAVFLLRYIVSGLEKHLFLLSDVGSHFRDIYRTLKLAALDKDDVVKFHAECGLAAVDAVMREQLTLSEAQLTGEDLPKIRVIR